MTPSKRSLPKPPKVEKVTQTNSLVNYCSTCENKGNEIYQNISSTLNAQTISEKYPAIFEWLQLFNTNIIVIIGIMILIAGINMITALLVLILERTQMIGILKALGSLIR